MALEICIDSREKAWIHILLKETFPEIIFTSKKMETSDYMSDMCCVERKTIDDLWNSIQDGRFHEQINRMATFQTDKVVVYLILGDIDTWKKKYESNRRILLRTKGIKLKKANPDLIHGCIASLLVRENIRVICHTDEKMGLIDMVRIIKKIEEERVLDFPSTRNPDTLAARLLDIPLQVWYNIKDVHGSSFCYLCTLKPKDFEAVPGVSKIRAKRMCETLKNGF